MHARAYYIVNGITLYRLITAPLLIVLIFTRQYDLFKWLLAVSFFTDAIDGWMARHYHVESVVGARLDSIADDCTMVAGITGMIVLKQAFFQQQLDWMILLLTIFLVQTSLAIIRYGKITSFHTYAAKSAAVLQGIFLLLLFFLPEPIDLLFYITASVTAFELFEETLLVLLIPKWQTNIKGLYWVLKRKQYQ